MCVCVCVCVTVTVRDRMCMSRCVIPSMIHVSLIAGQAAECGCVFLFNSCIYFSSFYFTFSPLLSHPRMISSGRPGFSHLVESHDASH